MPEQQLSTLGAGRRDHGLGSQCFGLKQQGYRNHIVYASIRRNINAKMGLTRDLDIRHKIDVVPMSQLVDN